MPRQTNIVVFGRPGTVMTDLVRGLRHESYAVRPLDGPEDIPGEPFDTDLVLIDAADRPDVVGDVRACRRRWPRQTTPLLVLGTTDPALSAAAIEAGATDSVVDALAGPMLTAHVRRVLRAGESLRHLLDEERQAKRESLARAAADVARPLGELLDELEAVMADSPVDDRLDELLELTGRAVDAVDRLRRLATGAEGAGAEGG